MGEALRALEQAVDECFPAHLGRQPLHGRGRQTQLPSRKAKRWQHKLLPARADRRRAESQLANLRQGNFRRNGNRMTLAFLARVALSWPSTCAGSFADAWRGLRAVGVSGRPSPPAAARTLSALRRRPVARSSGRSRARPSRVRSEWHDSSRACS